jgi:hypothetical protein
MMAKWHVPANNQLREENTYLMLFAPLVLLRYITTQTAAAINKLHLRHKFIRIGSQRN